MAAVPGTEPQGATRAPLRWKEGEAMTGGATGHAVSIGDLRELARRRLPRVIYGVLEGASEDERLLALTYERLRAWSLVPRRLRDVSVRTQATELFGRTWSSCFGIAPTGTIGVLRRDIEFHLADAARQANIPIGVSGASARTHEAIAEHAPGQVWSQLYAATDPAITRNLVERAEAFGAGALLWTVDLNIAAKNDRLIRAGFGVPPRLSLGAKVEALRHPGWLLEYLRGGMARLDQWAQYAPADADPMAVHRFYLSQRNACQSWRELELLRKLWKGPLIVKGILHADDAVRAAELGADGVVVSNHGGFGLDHGPAPIDMLPGVVSAAGEKTVVMYEGGILRGSDIVLARCLGARFCFVGRATLYGASAGGATGALRAIDILKDEIDRTIGHLGCPDARDLGPGYVRAPA
ncbi:alpha-hydroxy acid oxidase [Xenophilus azovorans]|uniref:alpha-hydroxy acid oxidase n=1 Tax=Xenophilus azovorans TaxID=151755 RepID=UPI00068C9DA5|nr:alpha-hydroxy acid oxidase [Xenophilus azovorans]